MRSMTGYGKAEYINGGTSITVEIKTVNNRFLDIIPKYPRCFISLDDAIKKTVQSAMKRGRVELFITYADTEDSGKNVRIDYGLAEQYVKANRELADKFGIESDLTALSLMRLPDVLIEEIDEKSEDELKDNLSSALSEALINLNKMRDVEGEKLKADLLARCDTVERLVIEIDKRAPYIKEFYRSKLEERIKEAVGDVKYDESRLLQEVAVFADKSNIDEELTRLKSHISQFRSICNGDGEIGKKLDFLMQEFNRETNTICSKSNDIEITDTALALKNEIEKMREQVQNIE